MRLCPVPITFHGDPALALRHSATPSRVTHGLPLCVDCCVLMSSYIIGLLTAPEKESHLRKLRVLDPTFTPLSSGEGIPLSTIEAQELHLNASYKTKEVDKIKTGGHVLTTLEAALWALWNVNDFEHVSGCFSRPTRSTLTY